jgi:hypothetical protein
MPFATYLANKALDRLLSAAAYTPDATLYVALFTVLPTAAGTGGTEVTGGSYARGAVTNDATNFPAASGGAKSNGTVITFPAATADWGTIVGFGIYDASTVGNLLYFSALTTAREVLNLDTFKFPAGSLTFTLV